MANNEAEKIKSLNETVHSKDKKERDQAYIMTPLSFCSLLISFFLKKLFYL